MPASEPAPAWLTTTLAQGFSTETEVAVRDAALADAHALKLIEQAAIEEDRPDPNRALGKLLASMYGQSRDERIVDVARRLAERSPRHHIHTLADIAWTMPVDRAEQFLLPLAFHPIPPSEPPRGLLRGGRAFAANYLVTRLAFDTSKFPRTRPAGAGPVVFKVDEEDPWCRCQQYGLVAAYGAGDHHAAKAAFERSIQTERKTSLSDHELGDLATLAHHMGIEIPPP